MQVVQHPPIGNKETKSYYYVFIVNELYKTVVNKTGCDARSSRNHNGS